MEMEMEVGGEAGEEEEENTFSIRRTKSGSLKDTLLYPVKQSASAHALDKLVLDEGEGELPLLGDDIDAALRDIPRAAESPAKDAASQRHRSKLQLVACTGLECEVMDLRQGNIFLPPFAKTSVKFEWLEKPRNVLVVIKPGEQSTENALLDAALVLQQEGTTVFVEENVKEIMEQRFAASKAGAGSSSSPSPAAGPRAPGFDVTEFRVWVPGSVCIDFIVTLGGDGTVLWVSSLFPRGVPPVLSFAMGTIGFLTNFPFSQHQQCLKEVVRGNQFLSLRTRMRCKLYSYNRNKQRGTGHGKEHTEHDTTSGASNGLQHNTEELIGTYVVLNEISLNRSPSSNLVDIDLFCDGVPVTKVQADGVLVSTPTGSTAYSLAAGGSVVHPAVSAMLLTPICPHSLSFRPLLFPDAVTLQLQIPHLSRERGTCVVAFDGKHKFEMGPGDCVTIQMSPHPLPSVVHKTDTEDWFQSLKGGLHWNRPNEEMRKPSRSHSKSADKQVFKNPSSHL
ncbi:NAD kinase [Chloropicon primus]|uniref:NAD kinase n=1 Tax=Chloropicon primus TaxID=1764295 RepID=A0A5B8MIV3_9CHLO|nr:NAD kinase [Chloropicon primus]|eukprot:QDZ20436.1 NAD kinase [Chloropicon primus]